LLFGPVPCTADDSTGPEADNDRATIIELVGKLKDQDTSSDTRRQAAYALGQLGPKARAAVPALIEATGDRDGQVIWYALDALGRIGPAAREAVPEILRVIQESLEIDSPGYRTLRSSAVRALGNIGPDARTATDLLEGILADSGADPVYRITAAVSLYQISGRPAAISALARELRNTKSDAALAAAMALYRMGPAAKPAERDLAYALGHADADVRRAAGRALSQFGTSTAPALVKALGYPDRFDRVAVVNTLGWILDQQRRTVLHRPETSSQQYAMAADHLRDVVTPALVKLLDDTDVDVRTAAIMALGRMGPAIAPVALKKLQEASGHAQQAAAQVLIEMEKYLSADIGSLEGVQQLKQALLEQLGPALLSRNANVRLASFRLVDALQFAEVDDVTRRALRDGLREDRDEIRRYAFRSLQRLTP
jgi:HEAT repeat protein